MLKRKETQPPSPITLDVYNADGVAVSKKELPGAIFNIPVKEDVVHFAVTVQQSNERAGTSHTKTRGEVRGGGKKPWRQKGTGRARHGSIRSPIWKGGGVVFGPRTDRNWGLRINKKVKRAALRMVLSDKAQNGALVLLEALAFDAPKTKEAIGLLARLPLASARKTRIGVVVPLRLPEVSRSMRNLPHVRILSPHRLNIVELLTCKKLVVPLKSLDEIVAVLSEKK